MFFQSYDIYYPVLVVWKLFEDNILRMEIRNASATPSKSNQLRNVNSIRLESRNITTQPGEIEDRKSEVIAFVVHTDMNITANNFYI